MRITKLTILVAVALTIISYNSANAAVDCSDPKGFHAKMKCKLQGMSGASDKPKKEGDGFWDKIKNFELGGKPVDRSS